MTDTGLIETLQEISRTLIALNLNSGWHPAAPETYLKHSNGVVTDLVISVRVISEVDGDTLQVMTYAGQTHDVGPSNQLINLAWS